MFRKAMARQARQVCPKAVHSHCERLHTALSRPWGPSREHFGLAGMTDLTMVEDEPIGSSADDRQNVIITAQRLEGQTLF
jgi:hypothetical protein